MTGEVPQIRSNAEWMLALLLGSQLPRNPKCFQDAIKIKTPKHSLRKSFKTDVSALRGTPKRLHRVPYSVQGKMSKIVPKMGPSTFIQNVRCGARIFTLWRNKSSGILDLGADGSWPPGNHFGVPFFGAACICSNIYIQCVYMFVMYRSTHVLHM